MNTAILTVVLTGSLLVGQNGTQTWQNDYSTAQRQGIAQKKPLLVVVGSGANGWMKVVGDATPNSPVGTLLTDKYVCLYVDLASPAGKKLAQDFGISQATGFVISDHTGTSQAFWHEGDMEISRVIAYLQQYAVPSIAMRSTETVNSTRPSYYPATNGFSNGMSGYQSMSRPAANC